MAVLLKNNVVSKLAGSIDTTQTTIAVTAGQGARFPNPGAGDWFPITLEAISGGSVTREIVHCTARSGDTLTVARAQEGTVGEAFTSGDRVELRYTQAVFESVVQRTLPTGAAVLPAGTTAQRPTPGEGYVRFNTSLGAYEGWDGSAWSSLGAAAASLVTYDSTSSGAAATDVQGALDGLYGGPDFTTMPTVGGDPIAESGSNSDGKWTRWADGTQLCRQTGSFSGSQEDGELKYTGEWIFPVSFAAANSYTFGGSTAAAIPAFKYIVSGNMHSPASTAFRITQAVLTAAHTETIPYGLSALGRWK